MAKFNMKEYENFMEEEARQDRLQEELESKREFETLGSEYDWHDYLEKQEEERRREEFNHYPEYDGYFDKDDFEDDNCNEDGYDPDDMETAYDPYGDLLFVPDEYDGYSDEDDSDDDYFIDDLLDLDDSDLEGMSATTERISRKAVARNRHLSKVKAKKSKVQKANYVAKREIRKCCKLYRNLDKAYCQLANKAYSNGFLPYSMCQNLKRRMNSNLDQMSDIILKVHYFKCILGAPMYKQALSAPKAM